MSLILYKTASIFKTLYDCKDTLLVVPARYGKSAILYDTEKIPSRWTGDSHRCETSKSL